MSFPRYQIYKDSGVEWLGAIPGHWDVGQSRRLFALRNERALVADKQLTASQVHGVIYQEDFIRLEGRKVVEVIKGADILKHVEPNDFVISMRSFQGGIEWCQVRGCISSAYVMLVPCDRIHGPFFQYLLKSQSYIQALQTTSNLVRDGQALRYDNFTQVDLPLVPLREQTQIAAFLDRETAKIDGLVAEQRRLMALLKEKRQAVISHTVTRGLNPGAPMKSSGIEWLGDVPAHWALPKLKDLASFCGGGTPSRENLTYWNGDIPWVSPKDMKIERIVGAEESITETGLRNSSSNLLSAGRVLMVVRSGILQHTIPVAINQVSVALNQDMKALEFDDKRVMAEFFMRWVQGLNDLLLLVWAKQGATVESVEQSYLANTVVPLPDLFEQAQIIKYLGVELAKFDTLTAEAQRAIDLLQERRTALISAAVTGQIDVRSAVASA